MKHISKRNQNAMVGASSQVTCAHTQSKSSWERTAVHSRHLLVAHSPRTTPGQRPLLRLLDRIPYQSLRNTNLHRELLSSAGLHWQLQTSKTKDCAPRAAARR